MSSRKPPVKTTLAATPRRARVAAKAVGATQVKHGLIVLDSSCWLEFLADSPRADWYAPALADLSRLVVPVLTVYEVSKKMQREASDEVAAAALSLMQQGRIVPVDLALALEAAVNGLPLADSLIYATARAHQAELWTQDAHFQSLPGVRFFAKDAAVP